MKPLPGFPTGPKSNELAVPRDNGLYIHLHLSESQKEPFPRNGEKYIVTIQGAQRGRKANIKRDVVWFAEEIVP